MLVVVGLWFDGHGRIGIEKLKGQAHEVADKLAHPVAHQLVIQHMLADGAAGTSQGAQAQGLVVAPELSLLGTRRSSTGEDKKPGARHGRLL